MFWKRSTVERIEEILNVSRCLFIRCKYGHYCEMRNKKLINRRNDITQGWQLCSPLISPCKRKGKKEKISYHWQHRVFVVGHPSMYYPRRIGLHFVQRTEHVAVLLVQWTFFLISKMRKGIKKRKKPLILHGCIATGQKIWEIWKWELLLPLVIGQAALSLQSPRSHRQR